MKEKFTQNAPVVHDFSKLATQSRGRELSESEAGLSAKLIEIFKTGQHDFTAVVSQLNEANIARPSGEDGPWTLPVLEKELRSSNESLDEDYSKNGYGA